MKTLFIALTALLSMTATANAAILASAPIYGGLNQALAVCYFFNAGTTAVNFTNQQLFDQNSNTQASNVHTNCGTLAPFSTCAFFTDITAKNSSAFVCRAVESSSAIIRGSFEIRDRDANAYKTRR